MDTQAGDPFDLSRMTLTSEQVAELARFQKKSEAKSRKLSRTQFVMLPYEEAMAAAGFMGNIQLAVLIELAQQNFKTHKNPVRLVANKALRAIGVSKKAKLRALRSLEAAGLISIFRPSNGKAQLVTLLWK
jgi:hypothetical protein